MKSFAQLLAVHLGAFLLGTGLFYLALAQGWLSTASPFLSVFFYRGVTWALIAGALVFALVVFIKLRWLPALLNYRDGLMAAVLVCSLSILYFTHIPVTADRSVTIFMLGYMNDHPGQTLSEAELEAAFVGKYVHEYRAMHRRLDEQVKSQTVEQTPQGYRLTERGKKLMALYADTVSSLGIDDRFVHPCKLGCTPGKP
ncbi:hypothetical protein SAMN02745857_04141 [Andreprevotia lacus DSM 23236]|jgi:hypothetical protein|uniref:Uncharacterized protein n=1 Tax=Andreprevotia lacus DSM 23236 TaxID=1121001 RepID=A0A1W1Y0Q8_9NEIS|nr:hypothetical protein [Andreprevotia lacus]SMC29800.1 hypothetical protein SAMN02745857_04141 [Andreprevotia lacus DSM 23236]